MASKDLINPIIKSTLEVWLKESLEILNKETEFDLPGCWFWRPAANQVALCKFIQGIPTFYYDSLIQAGHLGNKHYWNLSNELYKDSLIHEHLINDIQASFIRETVDQYDILISFLKTYIIATRQRAIFDQQVFDKKFEDFKELYESSELTLKCWATITNCVCKEGLEINLPHSVGTLRIRTLTPEDSILFVESIESIYETYQIPFSNRDQTPTGIPTIWNGVVEGFFKIKKELVPVLQPYEAREDFYVQLRKIFAQIETCLRLCCSNWLKLEPVFIWVDNSPFKKTSQLKVTPLWQSGDIPLGAKANYFEDSISQSVTNRWSKLQDVIARTKKAPLLNIILNRFNLSYGRGILEDKLIDQITSLEALFFGGIKRKRGKSVELSNRVADLIGGKPKEKKRIRKLIQDAYDLRSDVLHGNEYDSRRLMALFDEIEYTLRKSLNIVLDHGLFVKV